MSSSHFFEATSPSEAPPSHITVSFAQDPQGTLGTQLKNLDQVCRNMMISDIVSIRSVVCML